jgi:hypothetical protein
MGLDGTNSTNGTGQLIRDIRCAIVNTSTLPPLNITISSWTNTSGFVFPIDPTHPMNQDDCNDFTGNLSSGRRRLRRWYSLEYEEFVSADQLAIAMNYGARASDAANAALSRCIENNIDQCRERFRPDIQCCAWAADGPVGGNPYLRYKKFRDCLQRIPGLCVAQVQAAFPRTFIGGTTGNRRWSSVSMSADGNSILASIGNGLVYISTDGGYNYFTPDRSPGNMDWRGVIVGSGSDWRGVAVSADFSKLIAVGADTNMWISRGNRGERWSAELGPGLRFAAVSGNGQYMISADYGGPIFVHADNGGGSGWVRKDIAPYPNGYSSMGYTTFTSAALSHDGRKQVAANFNDYIYVSQDYGENWIAVGTQQRWNSVAMSSDGTKIFAVTSGEPIYRSSDTGATWSTSGTPSVYYAIATSSDGTKVITCTSNTLLISRDSGSTWASPRYTFDFGAGGGVCSGIDISADGTRGVVSSDGGFLAQIDLNIY